MVIKTIKTFAKPITEQVSMQPFSHGALGICGRQFSVFAKAILDKYTKVLHYQFDYTSLIFLEQAAGAGEDRKAEYHNTIIVTWKLLSFLLQNGNSKAEKKQFLYQNPVLFQQMITRLENNLSEIKLTDKRLYQDMQRCYEMYQNGTKEYVSMQNTDVPKTEWIKIHKDSSELNSYSSTIDYVEQQIKINEEKQQTRALLKKEKEKNTQFMAPFSMSRSFFSNLNHLMKENRVENYKQIWRQSVSQQLEQHYLDLHMQKFAKEQDMLKKEEMVFQIFQEFGSEKIQECLEKVDESVYQQFVQVMYILAGSEDNSWEQIEYTMQGEGKSDSIAFEKNGRLEEYDTERIKEEKKEKENESAGTETYQYMHRELIFAEYKDTEQKVMDILQESGEITRNIVLEKVEEYKELFYQYMKSTLNEQNVLEQKKQDGQNDADKKQYIVSERHTESKQEAEYISEQDNPEIFTDEEMELLLNADDKKDTTEETLFLRKKLNLIAIKEITESFLAENTGFLEKERLLQIQKTLENISFTSHYLREEKQSQKGESESGLQESIRNAKEIDTQKEMKRGEDGKLADKVKQTGSNVPKEGKEYQWISAKLQNRIRQIQTNNTQKMLSMQTEGTQNMLSMRIEETQNILSMQTEDIQNILSMQTEDIRNVLSTHTEDAINRSRNGMSEIGIRGKNKNDFSLYNITQTFETGGLAERKLLYLALEHTIDKIIIENNNQAEQSLLQKESIQNNQSLLQKESIQNNQSLLQKELIQDKQSLLQKELIQDKQSLLQKEIIQLKQKMIQPEDLEKRLAGDWHFLMTEQKGKELIQFISELQPEIKIQLEEMVRKEVEEFCYYLKQTEEVGTKASEEKVMHELRSHAPESKTPENNTLENNTSGNNASGSHQLETTQMIAKSESGQKLLEEWKPFLQKEDIRQLYQIISKEKKKISEEVSYQKTKKKLQAAKEQIYLKKEHKHKLERKIETLKEMKQGKDGKLADKARQTGSIVQKESEGYQWISVKLQKQIKQIQTENTQNMLSMWTEGTQNVLSVNREDSQKLQDVLSMHTEDTINRSMNGMSEMGIRGTDKNNASLYNIRQTFETGGLSERKLLYLALEHTIDKIIIEKNNQAEQGLQRKEFIQDNQSLLQKELIQNNQSLLQKELIQDNQSLLQKELIQNNQSLLQKELIQDNQSLQQKELIQDKQSLQRKELIQLKQKIIQPADLEKRSAGDWRFLMTKQKGEDINRSISELSPEIKIQVEKMVQKEVEEFCYYLKETEEAETKASEKVETNDSEENVFYKSGSPQLITKPESGQKLLEEWKPFLQKEDMRQLYQIISKEKEKISEEISYQTIKKELQAAKNIEENSSVSGHTRFYKVTKNMKLSDMIQVFETGNLPERKLMYLVLRNAVSSIENNVESKTGSDKQKENSNRQASVPDNHTKEQVHLKKEHISKIKEAIFQDTDEMEIADGTWKFLFRKERNKSLIETVRHLQKTESGYLEKHMVEQVNGFYQELHHLQGKEKLQNKEEKNQKQVWEKWQLLFGKEEQEMLLHSKKVSNSYILKENNAKTKMKFTKTTYSHINTKEVNKKLQIRQLYDNIINRNYQKRVLKLQNFEKNEEEFYKASLPNQTVLRKEAEEAKVYQFSKQLKRAEYQLMENENIETELLTQRNSDFMQPPVEQVTAVKDKNEQMVLSEKMKYHEESMKLILNHTKDKTASDEKNAQKAERLEQEKILRELEGNLLDYRAELEDKSERLEVVEKQLQNQEKNIKLLKESQMSMSKNDVKPEEARQFMKHMKEEIKMEQMRRGKI